MDPLTIALVVSVIGNLAGAAISASTAASEGGKTRDLAQKQSAELQALLNKVQAPKFAGTLTQSEIEALGNAPMIGDYIAGLEPAAAAGFMAALPGFAAYVIEREPTVREYIAALPPVLAMKILESEPRVSRAMHEKAPEVANFFAEQSPVISKFISDAPAVTIKGKSEDAMIARDAQKGALQALSKVGTEGDTIAQSEQLRMMNKLASQEAGQRGALTEEMARRGQLSSGRELLMKLAGQQASGQQAAEVGMKSYEDAQRRRLEALSQAGNLGTQMYGQEISMEKDNASIINAFNMRNTDSMRRIEENRTNAENSRLARDAQARQQYELSRVNDFNQWQQREIAAGRRLEEVTTAEYNAWQARETNAQRQYEREQADVKNIWQMREADYGRSNENLRVNDINNRNARMAAQENATNIANAGFVTQANTANAGASASVGVANANIGAQYVRDENNAVRAHQATQNNQARQNVQNVSNLTLSERARADSLAQQAYDNDMARIGHVSGVQQTQMNGRVYEQQGNIAGGQAIGKAVSDTAAAAAEWAYMKGQEGK